MKRGLITERGLIVSVVLLLCMGLPAAGCGKTSADTTSTDSSGSVTTGASSGTSGTTSSSARPAVTSGPFAEPDYLDPQPVDPAAIADLDRAGLSDTQKQVLARQSFVAVMQDPTNGPWKFWQVYETARYQGLPLFVTTDSVLNAYHGLFDTLLQRLEEAALYDQALTMTQALYAAASDQWNTATDPAVKEDARLNMAYFSVAASLLQGAPAAPDIVRDEVEAELGRIEAAEGIEESPILRYTEDYSQYIPRGHYTRSETLKRYFKTLMWYGHTAFFINPRDPDITEEEAVSLTRRALLVSASLVGEAKEAWLAIYEPTSFLVGRADDITVDDMESIIGQVFGTAQPEPDALADAGKIAAVREQMNELPAPKILSATLRLPGDTQEREENERSLRVMGQRYIPDSYAFQQLVWAYVGEEFPPEAKRDLPMGLDVMTVLGSDQAYRIEKEDFGQDRYKNWEEQIAKVHEEFAGRDPDLWPANLYTGWLESLQHVMAFPADGAPDFMKSRVWARKSLNTALGSWTELRHDTILYAKQSVTAEGGGGEEPGSAGYVEPYPAFYAKIAELAATLRQGLLDYDLIDAESANKLETMVWLAGILGSIAEKELSGEELTAEETATIAEYGHYLETLEQFDDTQEGRTLSPTAEKSPLVADVHSSYNTRLALEEATGYPLILYAVFELDGQLQLFTGASYAYYEFTVPLEERLTDEQWVALLDSGQAPPRPAWTDEWIMDGD
ncbi:MAG: DUF3160 domain-containing protein [Actinomycetia bacterium]|nr:DUF3160 domain-containing protein [Actinomycetes bacterium]